MGFLSYNRNFYDHELKKPEGHPATENDIYRARQLLRMLDDLTDEGYTELNTLLEREIHGGSRLHKYLKENHAVPFYICSNHLDAEALSYAESETELNQTILNAANEANEVSTMTILPFTDVFVNGLDMRRIQRIFSFSDIYGTRIFTAHYEENRMFETMASQEFYFRFLGIKDGRFYVRKCMNTAIENQALAEIKLMLSADEVTERERRKYDEKNN